MRTPPPYKPRKYRWERKAAGLYQTGDGRFRVHNFRAESRPVPAWHLFESDGEGGWSWWDVYARKADAQAVVPDPYRVAPKTGPDTRANRTNKAGRYHNTRDFIRAAARFARSAGERVGDMRIEELATLAGLAAQTDQMIGEVARRLNSPAGGGYSWQEVGEALGYPARGARAAAWQRYSPASKRSAAYDPEAASCGTCGANLTDGSGDGTGGHWQNCTAAGEAIAS